MRLRAAAQLLNREKHAALEQAKESWQRAENLEAELERNQLSLVNAERRLKIAARAREKADADVEQLSKEIEGLTERIMESEEASQLAGQPTSTVAPTSLFAEQTATEDKKEIRRLQRKASTLRTEIMRAAKSEIDNTRKIVALETKTTAIYNMSQTFKVIISADLNNSRALTSYPLPT